ncbi:transcriptional regulator opi1, partial [Kickxella alabastrina]
VGSNVIESGVRRMCEPITKRIDVTQLDTFACRQLDNLGYTAGEGSSNSSSSRNNNSNINNYNTNANIGSSNLRKRTKDQAEQFSNSSSNNNGDIDIDIDDNGKNKHGARDMVPLMAEESTEQAHQPGRWRMVNIMASAKERALAYREDTMRRLKYCLDWIIYATALLNQHMHDLRELLSSLRDGARIMFLDTEPEYASVATVGERGAEVPLVDVRGAAVRLGRARKEIVGTVTRAVGVISQYAGSVLPGEARRQVRGLILGLPGRFGAADPIMASAGSSVGSPSVASTGGSPMGSPRQHPADVRPADVEATARRTLALASESFVMLGSLQKVFSNLYGNAERWIGGAQQPVPVPVEAVVGPAYREPLASASLAGATSAASTASAPVRRPPRRLPPMNMTPANTAASTAAEADGSLVEIGERMRRMDMVHSADTGDRTAADTGSEVSYKRNRTREPTPS